jgi:hypothetical protein
MRNYEADQFSDSEPVNLWELAVALRVSRWTVYRWRKRGYQFEFGNRTTPGHCKAWLRENPTVASRTSKPAEDQRSQSALSRMRQGRVKPRNRAKVAA